METTLYNSAVLPHLQCRGMMQNEELWAELCPPSTKYEIHARAHLDFLSYAASDTEQEHQGPAKPYHG